MIFEVVSIKISGVNSYAEIDIRGNGAKIDLCVLLDKNEVTQYFNENEAGLEWLAFVTTDEEMTELEESTFSEMMGVVKDFIKTKCPPLYKEFLK